MGDARLIQLARLLGLPRDVVHGQSARGLVDDHATSVAKALFAEALASDDVSDTESMVAYLEDRLEYLSPYIGAGVADEIRAYARAQAKSWPRP